MSAKSHIDWPDVTVAAKTQPNVPARDVVSLPWVNYDGNSYDRNFASKYCIKLLTKLITRSASS